MTRAAAAAFAALLLAAPVAGAATLGSVTIDPSLAVTDATALFSFEDLGDGTGIFDIGGGDLALVATLFLLETGAPDPLGTSGLTLFADSLLSGIDLSGTLEDAAFDGSTVRFLFATDGGTRAAEFGAFFVATLSEFGLVADVPGDFPGIDTPASGTLTLNPATVVPLPGALALLLTGLGGLALVARRRAA